MGTSIRDIIKQRYGWLKAGLLHRALYIPEESGRDAGFPSNDFGWAANAGIAAHYGGTQGFPVFGATGLTGAVTNEYHGKFKVTTDGVATAIIQTTNGLSITTGAGSGDDCIIKTADQVTPAAYKKFRCVAKFQIDDRTLTKFALCFGTDSNDPIATPVADHVSIWHDTGNGVLLGKVRGNGGTVATDTTDTLPTISNATDYEMGIYFFIADSATNSVGWFEVDGTRYRMSSAQMTQLYAILTSPPTTFCGMLAIRTGSAVSRVVLLKRLTFFCDN